MRGQSVGIFPVKNTSPEPIVAELEKILDSGEAGLSQSMVKFQPIARSNAILVVARKPELLQAAATWIARLDGSSAASTGVKVYRVRYGDAKQIAKLLNDLFTGGGGGADTAANQLAPGSGSSILGGTGGQRRNGRGVDRGIKWRIWQSFVPASAPGGAPAAGLGAGTGAGAAGAPDWARAGRGKIRSGRSAGHPRARMSKPPAGPAAAAPKGPPCCPA